MSRKIIIDIETDSLDATCIWCVVCKEIHNTEYKVFRDSKSLNNYIHRDDVFIAHNGITFDFPVLNRLWGTKFKLSNVEDTLIMSRLFNPEREGGHSLDAWGQKLGHNKIEFHDFDQYSEEMLEYCKRDVSITEKLYHLLTVEGKDFSRQSIELEYRIAKIIDNQRTHGFFVDKRKAVALFAETKGKAETIKEEVHKHFLPRAKFIREVIPRYTKKGDMSKVGLSGIDVDEVGGPFSLIQFKPFNLGSPKQIIERLDEFGWKPVMFTPKGSPKICEENLRTVFDSAPEPARKLAEWKMLETRWKTVEAWLENLDRNDRIHGTVYTMGAVTGRMTHANPNMANIVSNDKPYGKECRACFTVPTAWWVWTQKD